MALGFSVAIDAGRLSGAVNRLRHVAANIDDKQLLQAIGNRHLKWMVQNLRDAGTETPHPPMSPNTLIKSSGRASPRHLSSRFRAFLQQSYTVKVANDHVDVGTQNEMAKWHHHGTDPFIIRPTNRKYLKFATIDGVVFAKEVHHPGIPARGLLPTKKTAEALALQVLTAGIRRAIQSGGLI